jgi:hypothetical protein
VREVRGVYGMSDIVVITDVLKDENYKKLYKQIESTRYVKKIKQFVF